MGEDQPAVADEARNPQLFIAGGIGGQHEYRPQRIQNQRQKGHGAEFAHGSAGIKIGKAVQVQAVQRCTQQAAEAAGKHFGKAPVADQHGGKIDKGNIDLIACLQRKTDQAQHSGNVQEKVAIKNAVGIALPLQQGGIHLYRELPGGKAVGNALNAAQVKRQVMPRKQKACAQRHALKNHQCGQPGVYKAGRISRAANGQRTHVRQQQKIQQHKKQQPAKAGNPRPCMGGGESELIDAAGAAVVGKLKAGGGVAPGPQAEGGIIAAGVQQLRGHGHIIIILKNLSALHGGFIGHTSHIAALFQAEQRRSGKGAVILVVDHGHAAVRYDGFVGKRLQFTAG